MEQIKRGLQSEDRIICEELVALHDRKYDQSLEVAKEQRRLARCLENLEKKQDLRLLLFSLSMILFHRFVSIIIYIYKSIIILLSFHQLSLAAQKSRSFDSSFPWYVYADVNFQNHVNFQN